MGDFRTITCSNGREAMELIEERYSEISLILLDVMMPGISGYSVLKKIKENDKFKNIIVILFSVKNLDEDIQKGKNFEADGYLTKPFSGKDLLKYVKEKIKQ